MGNYQSPSCSHLYENTTEFETAMKGVSASFEICKIVYFESELCSKGKKIFLYNLVLSACCFEIQFQFFLFHLRLEKISWLASK